ncbi:MAG: hypothetical protein OZSIB_0671 [Candidatus Ozemobacter sibiricus]|jgi:hypothetical protein|uniref:DUF3108 domain-containing protein n=1 Tax=Candidatus Ozemobacter sibiricus TaxID=2268124 RepID=A0A367ZUK8_9BACT|nr:MAG: hypothetical protein OZSIB_0671 [Candidatus Ozemobacter sibiricus]
MKRRNFGWVVWLVTIWGIGLAGSVLAQSADVWEAYEINAQYRGGVKKGFEELGCAVAGFLPQPDGSREVVFHACVRDPEHRKKFYGIRLKLAYSFDPKGQVKTISERYAWFDNFEPQHQDQIKDMILLLATIKDGSLLQSAFKELLINATTVKITGRTGSAGKSMELDIERPGDPRLEGKFFLKAASPAWNLTKFRMKRGKISVSFVTNPLAQIQAEYQTKEPFSRVVFGR